jgi:hypothetical protein
MARKHTHYVADAYRQVDANEAPTLIESAVIVAYDAAEAIREAELVRAQFKPDFIVVRERSRKDDRIVHRSWV